MPGVGRPVPRQGHRHQQENHRDGSTEERKAHLADVIGEFLDAGVFAQEAEYFHEESQGGPDSDQPARPGRPNPFFAAPISQEELDRFVKIDLRRLDNAEYFKKYFG